LAMLVCFDIYIYDTNFKKPFFGNEPPLAEVIDSINTLLPRAILMVGLLKRIFHMLVLN